MFAFVSLNVLFTLRVLWALFLKRVFCAIEIESITVFIKKKLPLPYIFLLLELLIRKGEIKVSGSDHEKLILYNQQVW